MIGAKDSTEIEVAVLWEGREIKRIRRPVRTVDGQAMVRYKGNLHPLRPGRVIELSRRGENTGVDAGDLEPPQPPLSDLAPRLDIPVDWDDPQRSVIEAAPNARLLVDAGPGTGKTAVACARVARLIDHHDVPPTAIWFVSFTRTAVQEIRQRLQAYLPEGQPVSAVKIATIDSHAWALHSGFDQKASLSGSYEENIASVAQLIQSHEGVFEHLQTVAHLVIDEAQDVVGQRAELVMALIGSLSPGCGITIFSDEAQAIYGFADEDGGSQAASGCLIQKLRESSFKFTPVVLTNVRRTGDPRLRQIFTDVRQIVLDPRSPKDETRFQLVRQRVMELAHKQVSELNDAIAADAVPDSTFVLFRRRADALRASSFRGIHPHRLRMSGLPAVVEPWIAVIFTDFTAKRMSRSEFEKRWPRVTTLAPAHLDVSQAWQLLVRLAGESTTVVSVPEIRKKLSRLSPPPEVCRIDFGLPGPLFGTIHASKGREADDVALMVPPNRMHDPKWVDPDEEARVLFVGATRARRELVVVKPYVSAIVRRTDTGRACILWKDGTLRAQVEIGRDHDLSATGLAGKSLFASAEDVDTAQTWLRESSSRMNWAVAATHGNSFAYYVSAQSAAPAFAVLENHVNDELFKIGGLVRDLAEAKTKLRPAGWIPHVRVFGARTCAVPVGPGATGLHEPWSVSGFMLAPLIQAFTTIEFKPYER